MKDAIDRGQRLPKNFHETFIPERQYIHALMRFAASGKSGNILEIASETGIPTGKSSGKVQPTIHYCIGMGMIQLTPQKQAAIKKPELTPFGRIVFLEDPFLKEHVTQWIAHFNLCNPLIGAEIWYQVFFKGFQSLGNSFSRTQLNDFLCLMNGVNHKKIIGPLVRMYEDDAAFKICGALSSSGDEIHKNPAPISNEFAKAYGAWLLQLLADHFPNNPQVTVTDLENKAGWQTIPSWTISDIHLVLEIIEQKGILEVDRHMTPWILYPTANLEKIWMCIYDDLI
jgi:hypothetical protein